jgi:ribose 5-phosphate isomerase B
MDHRGVCLRQTILNFLCENGIQFLDRGPENDDPVDYPLYAHRVVQDIRGGAADFGVLVCGTGTGMAMAANRFRGIRAAVATSTEMAEFSRRHGHANVLCIGSRWQEPNEVLAILCRFFSTPAEGGRHARRVGLLDAEGLL